MPKKGYYKNINHEKKPNYLDIIVLGKHHILKSMPKPKGFVMSEDKKFLGPIVWLTLNFWGGTFEVWQNSLCPLDKS